jgi:hypothetical protein
MDVVRLVVVIMPPKTGKHVVVIVKVEPGITTVLDPTQLEPKLKQVVVKLISFLPAVEYATLGGFSPTYDAGVAFEPKFQV